MLKDFNGSINFYRFFDVGSDIDLSNVLNTLSSTNNEVQTFKLKTTSRAIVIEETPIVVSLNKWIYEIDGKNFQCDGTLKVWPFGAISVVFSIQVENLNFKELKTLAKYIEESDELHDLALSKVKTLVSEIESSIKYVNIWEQFEDYIIYVDKNTTRDIFEIEELIKNDDLFELILGDDRGTFSNQMKEPIKKNIFQYHTDDFVVIDWNSAYICSEGDSRDISDVLEFSICQLLELRYYDDLLDKKLASLYKSIQTTSPSIFNKSYNKISKEAAEIYVETIEVIEKIENSLKVIGDFYYAKIFRASIERLRIKDWEQNVDNKLKNLITVSSLYQAEVNNNKSFWMELIIIVLIAAEVFPFLYNILMTYYFPG